MRRTRGSQRNEGKEDCRYEESSRYDDSGWSHDAREDLAEAAERDLISQLAAAIRSG